MPEKPKETRKDSRVDMKDSRAGVLGDHAAIHGGIHFGDQVVTIGNVTVYLSRIEEKPAEKSEDGTADIGPNPYVGLGAFQERDADRFFGREKLTKKLWGKLRYLNEPGMDEKKTRLLPILGPSGSGKSSVARAGLIRELGRNPLPGFRKARVAVLTPGTKPVYALAGILARIETGDSLPAAKTREFQKELKIQSDEGEFDGLARIAHLFPDIHSSPLIILVDQFEEVFSLCEDETERECFIKNLLHAASDAAGYVSVVLTMRSDFLGETQSHEALNRTIAENGEIIPALNREELRRAIAGPAEQAGHPLDDALVDRLIEETRDREGALPLLQFALTRIWDGMANGESPSDTLKKIGGVGGALAGEANRLYRTLSPHDRAIVRRAFRRMVNPGEGIKDTRRRVPLDNIVGGDEEPAHVKKVLKKFSDKSARLITLGESEAGDLTAEISHEALLEHWKDLKEWLNLDRDALRLDRRLESEADHWEKQSRPPGLLWRSPNLDLARNLYQERKEDFSSLQKEFYLASEQARIDSERKAKWRQRLYAIVSILIIIGISIAYFIVRKQKEIAIQNELNSKYNLALLFEDRAGVALSAALKGDNPDENFQKAWLYTLEALSLDIPDEKKLPTSQKRLAMEELHTGLVYGADHDSTARYKGFAADNKNLQNLESDLSEAYSKAGKNAPEFKAVCQISLELFPYKMEGITLVPVQKETLQSNPWYADYPRSPGKDPVQWMIEATAKAVRDKKLAMKGESTGWITPYVNSVSSEPSLGTKPEPLINDFGMTFVYIEPGSFFMGSPLNESGRESNEAFHMVTLNKGFYMQTTEVTQGQWKAVMGENPSFFQNCGDNCPVEMVSWEEAKEFIRILNEKEGRDIFRLPTEAEWEYACRAGTTTPFFFGGCLSTDQANYAGNSPYEGCPQGEYRKQTTPVGNFPPNEFGLYDMHGNVFEWCEDDYDSFKGGKGAPDDGSAWIDRPKRGVIRVLRGGSWYSGARLCRSAYRYGLRPGGRSSYIGFRLARSYP